MVGYFGTPMDNLHLIGWVANLKVQLSDQFTDDMPVHVGEAPVDRVVADGHAFVVDAQ